MVWPFTRKEKSGKSDAGDIMASIGIGRIPTVKEQDGDWFTFVSGPSTSSPLHAVPAAYAAVNILTSQLAPLRRRVVRHTPDGIEEHPNHPANGLMQVPSRMVDPHQCWRLVISQYIADGNGVAWLRRDFSGRTAIEIVPARIARAEWVTARNSPYARYDLELLGSERGTGGTRRVQANSRDILAFHGPGFDGLKSPSPIQYAARTILETMVQSATHHKNKVSRGLNAGIALLPREGALNSMEQWQEALELLRTEFSGATKAGELPFLPPGIEVANMHSISNLDLALVDILKWGVEDVARVFNLSPIRLGHFQTGMRARTFEAQAVDFERYSIMPHAEVMDAQLTRKLLSSEDIRNGLAVKTDTSAVSLGTYRERVEAAELAVTRGGIMTINEGRRMLDLPALPDGDKLLEPKGAPAQSDGNDGGGQGND